VVGTTRGMAPQVRTQFNQSDCVKSIMMHSNRFHCVCVCVCFSRIPRTCQLAIRSVSTHSFTGWPHRPPIVRFRSASS
jgi:hypothetical protein